MRIQLNADISKYDYLNTGKKVIKNGIPNFMPYQIGYFILFIFLGFLITTTIYLIQNNNIGFYNFHILGALLFILIGLVWITFAKSKRMQRAFQESPLRQGTQTITIDADGICVENNVSKSQFSWQAVTGYINERDGLILTFGGIDFYPIPYEALPAEISRDEFMDIVEGWIVK